MINNPDNITSPKTYEELMRENRELKKQLEKKRIADENRRIRRELVGENPNIWM